MTRNVNAKSLASMPKHPVVVSSRYGTHPEKKSIRCPVRHSEGIWLELCYWEPLGQRDSGVWFCWMYLLDQHWSRQHKNKRKRRQTFTEEDCPLIRTVEGNNLSKAVGAVCQGAGRGRFHRTGKETLGMEDGFVGLVPSPLNAVDTNKSWYVVFLGASQLLTACRGCYQCVNFPVQSISAHLGHGVYYPLSINFKRAAVAVFHTCKK